MKKIIFALLLSIFLIPCVKADTTINLQEQDFIPLTSLDTSCSHYSGLYLYSDFETFISNSNNKVIFDTLYKEAKDYYYDNYHEAYPYYDISVNIVSSSSSSFILHSVSIQFDVYDSSMNGIAPFESTYEKGTYRGITGGGLVCDYSSPSFGNHYGSFHYEEEESTFYYTPLKLFESNYNLLIGQRYSGLGYLTFNLYNSDNILKSTYTSDDYYPVYLESTYDEYVSSIYTTVNLDNYEYVILNLKDYSKKDAFETNLQVKGSVGITPVYEFGTVEKEFVTDICNISYTDFTDYRFFILKNDLLNNAAYYVKACKEGSSFKFDNTVFDITYVTLDNANAPVITVNGVEYNTIPYDNLSNTANKNTVNGFIPGSSEQFDPFGDVVDYISSFWNSLTTFMGLVTKFFNTLPVEIRAISITMFTTAITLGVIKFIKS